MNGVNHDFRTVRLPFCLSAIGFFFYAPSTPPPPSLSLRCDHEYRNLFKIPLHYHTFLHGEAMMIDANYLETFKGLNTT